MQIKESSKLNKTLLEDCSLGRGNKNKLKLVENTNNNSNGPVLATLYGVLSDFGNETRNDRWYSKELWEQALNDPFIKEMLDTNTLYGEPDHPIDLVNLTEDCSRLETNIPQVSHIIREPKIDYNDNTIKGYLDILDTPNGRIIKTLIDYGCVLGVSSRGTGETITDSNGRTMVNPDTYQLITWDIVARPSNKAARVNPIDINKNTRNVGERLKSQVEKLVRSKDTKNLMLAEKLVKRSNVSNKQELIEYINRNLDNTNIKEVRNDIDEAYNRISELLEENKNLKSQVEDLQNELSQYQDNDLQEPEDNNDNNNKDNIQLLYDKINDLEDYIKGNTNDNCNIDIDDNQYIKDLELENDFLYDKLQDVMNIYLDLTCLNNGVNKSEVLLLLPGKITDYEIRDIDDKVNECIRTNKKSIIKESFNNTRNSISNNISNNNTNFNQIDFNKLVNIMNN